jgi:hypothetical protein
MHITTGITLNPSKDRKEAVGKNTKWYGKLSEPPPTPLSAGHSEQLKVRSEFNAAGTLRKEGNEEQAFSPSAMYRIQKTAQAKTLD